MLFMTLSLVQGKCNVFYLFVSSTFFVSSKVVKWFKAKNTLTLSFNPMSNILNKTLITIT